MSRSTSGEMGALSAHSFLHQAFASADKEAWGTIDRCRPDASLFVFGNKIISRLLKLTTDEFELLTAKVLGSFGVEGMKITAGSSDGGIDGHGRIAELNAKVAFQAKRWGTTKVGRTQVAQFIGDVHSGGFDGGVFVTTSTFTPAANAEANNPRTQVVLLEGTRLARIMLAMNLGVTEHPD